MGRAAISDKNYVTMIKNHGLYEAWKCIFRVKNDHPKQAGVALSMAGAKRRFMPGSVSMRIEYLPFVVIEFLPPVSVFR